ncbi:hypothetical protein CIW54_15740 [Paraburkholderia sp. T12-10]|nr:hypothetical protein CIW54_15740 [Paraburkholderia sp. T12-10]
MHDVRECESSTVSGRSSPGTDEVFAGLKAIWYTEEFAALSTSTCTLAVGIKRTMDLLGSGAAIPESNRSLILELHVKD